MIRLFFSFFKRVTRSVKTRYLLFRDSMEVLLRQRHVLIPPKRYDYINIGANEQIGKEYLQHFIMLGDLKHTDRVLEVGCGFGRMAIPLTTFLSLKGSYEGLEIIKDGVNWCKSKFTSRFPNFKFQYINVYNERYNPKGQCKGTDYIFPFEDNSFDFVYLTSVFTHMFSDDVENYLSEISRVLKPKGKCFITYFILNEYSLDKIKNNESKFTFLYKHQNYYFEDKTNPEFAVSYDEAYISKLHLKFKINIQEIHYGGWSGKPNYISFQDIIVGVKT